MTGRVLVVVPTYDEAQTLPGTLARLRAAVPDADVLVVDDASPDGTGALADRLAAADPAVQVLHRAGKQGLGKAYVAGFGWGLERGYEVLVEMDADGSHQPEELPALLAALAAAPGTSGPDLVIGSRWVPGGRVLNWPWHRALLSRGANTYTRVAIGMPVRDATAGFRAYRSAVLRAINLADVESQGYCFQVDMTWRTLQAGALVREVPISFVERAQGRSKMSNRIIVEALVRVTVWGMSRRAAQARAVAGRAVAAVGGRRPRS